MTQEIKYKDVPLNDDELELAEINLARTKVQIRNLKANLGDLDEDEANNYTVKLTVQNAKKNLKDLRTRLDTELNTAEMNLKVYERQVKTKSKEVEVEEEEVIEDTPSEVEADKAE